MSILLLVMYRDICLICFDERDLGLNSITGKSLYVFFSLLSGEILEKEICMLFPVDFLAASIKACSSD